MSVCKKKKKRVHRYQAGKKGQSFIPVKLITQSQTEMENRSDISDMQSVEVSSNAYLLAIHFDSAKGKSS